MKLRRGIALVLYTNLFIAGAAALLVLRTYALFGGHTPGEHQYAVVWVAFWGTLFTYNLCAFYESDAPGSEKFAFIKRYQVWYRRLFGLTIIAPLFAVGWLNTNQFIFILHLAVISFFYTVPIGLQLPAGHYLRIPSWRQLPFLKTALVAYVWGSVTVIFPMLSESLWLDEPNIIRYFLAQSLFVLGITLPFDIRDYQTDQKVGLPTLANVWGITINKVVAVSMIGFAWLLLPETAPSVFFAEKMSYLLGAIGALGASEKRPEWYYTGLLDALLYLPFLIGCWL